MLKKQISKIKTVLEQSIPLSKSKIECEEKPTEVKVQSKRSKSQ